MNPVRDIALAVQSVAPATDAWAAASVMIGIIGTGTAVLAVAALAALVINKMVGDL